MLYTIQLNLLLNCVDGDITAMRHVSEQSMRAWLIERAGPQGLKWKFKPRLNIFSDKTHGIEVKIEDTVVAMMFKLAFSDYLNQDVDISAN